MAIVIGSSASSWAAIRIRRINFNPAGLDSGTNSHLNRESIVIKSTGSRAVQMKGWKILDRGRDHVYRFGFLLLGPGERIKLHSGRGNDGAFACEAGEPCPDETLYHFYWGLDDYVWNNSGDVARLKKRSGRLVDRCRYSSSGTSPMGLIDFNVEDEVKRC